MGNGRQKPSQNGKKVFIEIVSVLLPVICGRSKNLYRIVAAGKTYSSNKRNHKDTQFLQAATTGFDLA